MKILREKFPVWGTRKIELQNTDIKRVKLEGTRQENKLKNITFIVVTFIVILLFLTGYSIGKSITSTLIKTDTQIAEPILFVDSNPAIDITATQTDGTYRFYVKNYDENDCVTEVDLRYWIEIKANTEAGISYELYKNGQKLTLDSQKKTGIQEMTKEEKKTRCL